MSLPNAITREDFYLNKIANPSDDHELPDAITRTQHYLKAIAENAGGGGLPEVSGDDNGDILAVSSGTWGKSDKLKAVVNAGIDDNGKIPIVGVSGNWSLTDFPANELPTVSGADDGKVLGVTNGAWDAVTINSGELVVFKIDNNNQLLDNKTFSDVVNAVSAGNDVAIQQGGYLYRLMYIPDGGDMHYYFIKFQFIGTNNVAVRAIYFNSANPGNTFAQTNIFRCVPTVSSSTNRQLLSIYNNIYEYIDLELPAVTAADNGKILKVVNGAWAAVTP